MNLDICITYRCNARCKNCIEFCNREEETGISYAASDMTMEQVREFIRQVRELNIKPLFNQVFVTGGEPFLHPLLEIIFFDLLQLEKEGYFKVININSNGIIEPPEILKPYVITFSQPKDNHELHSVTLLHPEDLGTRGKKRKECKHYRKDTAVLNFQGFSLCCAADAYIRLFAFDHLIIDHVPRSIKDFPDMDEVCVHCPFGVEELVPLEKDKGHPVSKIYQDQAELNRQGRRITKRFPPEPPPFQRLPEFPYITWVCVTYNRPRMLGHLIHCFLEQDYPKDRCSLVILDDAGQYETQSRNGWTLISIPQRFNTLGQKRNAATALIPPQTDIICPVDDDNLYLTHMNRAFAASLREGDWAIPSIVFHESSQDWATPRPYCGHSTSWAYRTEAYNRTTGYSRQNVGEDGGLQIQLENLHLRIVDPIALGFEPYCVYTRLQDTYYTYQFQEGDYQRNPASSSRYALRIERGYCRMGDGIRILSPEKVT